MGTFIIDSKLIDEIAEGTSVLPELDDTLFDFIKKFHERTGVYPTLREMSRGLKVIYPERDYSHWVANRAIKRLHEAGLITYILSDESSRRSYARLIINDIT